MEEIETTEKQSAHEGGSLDTCTAESCRQALARQDRWVGDFMSVEQDGLAHFHHRDELHARVRADHDAEFVRLCEKYFADTSDFAAAWHYLVNHPIFHRPRLNDAWGRTYSELSAEERDYLDRGLERDDSDGLSNMWVNVSVDSQGATWVQLEHGPHLWGCDVSEREWPMWPAEGQQSHDFHLDVCEPTYEQAIVRLALKVHELYGEDRSRVRS